MHILFDFWFFFCNFGTKQDYFPMTSTITVQSFMRAQILAGQDAGKVRKVEIYTTTLNSFNRFLEGKDLSFREMTPVLMGRYEQWLSRNHVRRNTSSFYLRILRAIYNQAVDRGLTRQQFPFKHVYTGIGETVKRALPLSSIRKLKTLDLDRNPRLDFARDMFLFSFYTRGMSFVDMAFLRWENIQDGRLLYARRKTGKMLSIRWEPCMQAIVDKYRDASSGYLLPILHEGEADEKALYRQYKSRIYAVNCALKEISSLLRMQHPITTYTARHSWASIAYHKDIPLSVISEGMGHHSEKMTRIYLASLDYTAIDRANCLVWGELLR